MGTLHLTKRLIDQAQYEGIDGAAYVLWDDIVQGLGLRIYPTGKKSFMLKYRIAGRQRNLVLGQYGKHLTLEQARDTAVGKLSGVIQGEDPLEIKQVKYHAPTVKDFALEYLANHAKARKKSWRNDESQINRLILPAWGIRKLESISTADVIQLHRKIGRENGKYQANRTIATVSKMFEIAVRWGYLEKGSVNPAQGIEKFKEEKRHRAIEEDEFPRLAKAIEAEESPYVRAAIWLLLFIGCRKTELLTAKWEQVDFEKRTITFPETKSGKAYTAPLSGPAIDLLQNLWRGISNPYIFPGRRKGQHLVNLMKPWQKILKNAGLPKEIRLHDLRHTFGTMLSNAGVSLTLVGAAMNHSQPSVTARYAMPSENPVRVAMEEQAARLVAAAKGEKAEVIIFEEAKKA